MIRIEAIGEGKFFRRFERNLKRDKDARERWPRKQKMLYVENRHHLEAITSLI